jgi:hypothetical protein
MSDLRTEIRAAFAKEQSAFPPPFGLRDQVDAAVQSRIRAAAPARHHRDRNLDWLMVAAAILLTIAIVAGLLATRLINFHPIPVRPGPVHFPASWTVTGSMVTARSGHTATLLPVGKVLVVGGILGNRVLASAELYDPTTGTWSATGNMLTPRASHTATLLTNGKVLVAGGYGVTLANGLGSDIVASAELWEPSTGKWTATGNMVTPHYGHTATLLFDGEVLVAGGILTNFVMASAELYDPSTAKWTATGKMITPRAFHTATVLHDGRVFVAGGADYANYVANGGLPEMTATAELYDPATRNWTATRSMASASYGHAAALLPDGRVLVAGGMVDPNAPETTAVEVYDPRTGTWAPTGPNYTPYAFRTATALRDGTVLVLHDGGGASLYLPGSNLWTGTGNTTVRSNVTATLMPDGTVLVAGGSVQAVGGASLASAELYHSSPVPVLPAAGAVAPGTYFIANPYIAGGPFLNCDRGCSGYNRIIFTLPAGWTTNNGLVYKHLNQPDEVAFSFWTVDQVYADPCHWQGSLLSALDLAGHSHAADGAIVLGPYKGGLANQALRGPIPRALTQVALWSVWGGVSGPVGALQIDLSVPAGLNIATCDQGQFRSWTVWEAADPANAHYAAGQLDTVYEVDVDRRALVIDVSRMPASSAADVAELNAIVATMIVDRG